MPKRIDTTSQDIFDIRRANDNHVIFDLSTNLDCTYATRIKLPVKSKWSAGPHWHERHVELLRVIQGKILMKLNGESRTVAYDDGIQVIDKFVVHEWMRADAEEEANDNVEVIVEEWTDPADGEKHVFFRNLFSSISADAEYLRKWKRLQVLLTMSAFDNFEVIVPGRLAYVWTHGLYFTARVFGILVGLRSWYTEYTPRHLRNTAAGRAQQPS